MARTMTTTMALFRYAMLGALIAPRVVHAQSGEAVREGNPSERREALGRLWDGVPGTDQINSGADYLTWLRAGAGAMATRGTGRMSVQVPNARQWSSIGPFGLFAASPVYGSAPQLDAGRVASLAFHPSDPRILYLGTAAGGLWRSVTEGAIWEPLNTQSVCNSLVFGAVVVDPVTPQTVYAGTGDFAEGLFAGKSASFAAGSCGLLRSTDGGSSWTRYTVPGPSGADFQPYFARLVVDRTSAGSLTATVLVAATNRGIYRSTNSGTSWTNVQDGTFSDVAQEAATPTTLYAASRSSGSAGAALWRSVDRGITWQQVREFPGMRRLSIATSAARPRAVFIVAAQSDRSFGGVSRWDDISGATGTLTPLDARGITAARVRNNEPNFGTQSEYNLVITVDQRDANVLFVAGVEAFKSTNGGASFSHIGRNIHVDWHAIAIDPANSSRVFAGNDGGAFLSHDGGASFADVNQGLATTMHYPGMAVHPTDPTAILTGMQDNGTVFARNGATQWVGVYDGDGGFAAIDATDPGSPFFYVSSQQGNIQRIQNPLGFDQVRRNISPDTTPTRAFIAPFVLDQARPTRLYFGATQLYRSTDRGDSWLPISPQISPQGSVITAIAVSPRDSTVILVGANDGTVRYSRTFGTSWLAPANATFPARPVTDVAIDPNDARRMAVTFGGTGERGNVFFTVDGGVTWVNRSSNLPDVTTMAVAYGPGASLYLGNMFGVYRSENEGATWTREDGVPFVRVTDLVYSATTNRLVAATYGRGIWSFSFGSTSPVLRGDADGNGVVNAADATVIQQALLGMQLSSTTRLFPNGDANCDGKVEILDAIQIIRFVASLPNQATCVNTLR